MSEAGLASQGRKRLHSQRLLLLQIDVAGTDQQSRGATGEHEERQVLAVPDRKGSVTDTRHIRGMLVCALVYLFASLVDRARIRRGGIPDLDREVDDFGRARCVGCCVVELEVGKRTALIRGTGCVIRVQEGSKRFRRRGCQERCAENGFRIGFADQFAGGLVLRVSRRSEEQAGQQHWSC